MPALFYWWCASLPLHLTALCVAVGDLPSSVSSSTLTGLSTRESLQLTYCTAGELTNVPELVIGAREIKDDQEQVAGCLVWKVFPPQRFLIRGLGGQVVWVWPKIKKSTASSQITFPGPCRLLTPVDHLG